MDITTLLANTLSPDQATLEDARQKLELFRQENYPQYIQALSQCLINEQVPNHVRHAAGLAFKNTLTAKDHATHEEQIHRWLQVDEAVRRQIKDGLVGTLATPDKQASTSVAQSIAAVAAVELPHRQWDDLIPSLLASVTSTTNVSLKKATMMTFGFICEQVQDEALMDQSSDILTAVVTGARKEETSVEVRLEAIKALNNSLEFIKTHFEREGERNIIMQVVCEGTQSESVDVKVASFECMVRIMQQYYMMMHVYMEKALFGLTVSGMNDPEPNVALQAIEFWSTVCDDELDIRIDIQQAEINGNVCDRVLYDFARQAQRDVVPVLLWLLTKQEEEEDEDEWNVSMAAATCLALFAQCVGDEIVSPVVRFVSENIQSQDWRAREAAVMAFGSILEGPDPAMLKSLVDEALTVLISMMRDSVPNVRDTVAWTLGRVCEHLAQSINVELHLDALVHAILQGLQDNPRIVGNCCWALMNLADEIGTPLGNSEPTGTLSRYFDTIIKALLQFTQQCTENESNCRTSAYEAMSSLIIFSADDCIPLVQEVVLTILDRLEASIAAENQILGQDDRANQNELQSSLLGVLTNSIRRLPKDIAQVSDRIMTVVLQLLSKASSQTTTTEDALLLISAMTAVLDTDFSRYAEAFVPILFNALQNAQEYQLISIALGNVGDIFRALGPNAVHYCQEFMQILANLISNPLLHPSVKPTILSCFGDIAMAVGDKFEPYVEVTMIVLNQAAAMRASPDSDPDFIEFSNILMEAVVEAYVGIIQGMRTSPNVMMLQNYMPAIVQFVGSMTLVPSNDDLDRALVGLLGDIAEVMGTGAKPYLGAEWVVQFLKEVRSRRYVSKATKDTIRWAREMIKLACQ